MHRGGYLSPLRDLCGGVDTGDVAVAGGAGGNDCRFGDEEGARDGGPLSVVLCCDGKLDVRGVGAVAG